MGREDFGNSGLEPESKDLLGLEASALSLERVMTTCEFFKCRDSGLCWAWADLSNPKIEQGQLPVQTPLSPAQILNVSVLTLCVCVCVLMYACVPEYTLVQMLTHVGSHGGWHPVSSLISSFETGFLPSLLLLPQFWVIN